MANLVWVVEVLMKRILAVLVVFGTGVSVGTLLQDKPPVAQAGQEPQCAALLVTKDGEVIQDMNGDGQFNAITEAVYLLQWAFLGGPAPVPPCAEGGPSGLPDTGQTRCYAANGSQIPCDSATCPGQDGFYATGMRCPLEARFVDNQNCTVTDTCTGLVWLKDTADVNEDGQTNMNNGSDAAVWCGALAYCENLSFAGHDDWRLPNIVELRSLVGDGQIEPAIDPIFGAVSAFYWSSTSVDCSPTRAWGVDFGPGELLSTIKTGGAGDSDGYIRAVRSVR
jgi:hypothetical protein